MSNISDNGRDAVRRRLMFVASEDYYFLAYTLLLLLTELRCESSALNDYGKVGLLADFVGSDTDLRLLESETRLGEQTRRRLALLYDRALARRAPLERVVHALEERELIRVVRRPGESEQVFLVTSSSLKSSLDTPLMSEDRDRIRRLRALFPKLRTMTSATLRTRMFDNHGVRTWDA